MRGGRGSLPNDGRNFLLGREQRLLLLLLLLPPAALLLRARRVPGRAPPCLALRLPAPAYCMDNAAMIAGLGAVHLESGRPADLSLSASARST